LNNIKNNLIVSSSTLQVSSDPHFVAVDGLDRVGFGANLGAQRRFMEVFLSPVGLPHFVGTFDRGAAGVIEPHKTRIRHSLGLGEVNDLPVDDSARGIAFGVGLVVVVFA